MFQRLFELCERNDQTKIIIEQLKKVEEISADWALSLEERRELFRASAHCLDRNQEP